ncbi:MAG: DUF402 domain-containing protein [Acholeplasmataceae bacterium]|nr:DUF402 domain-containing protein [Acholeplasmataceae bacterium]
MINLPIGDTIQIYAYKHDGNIHRIWRQATLLDKDEHVAIFANIRTRVIESSGRNWMSKEPAIIFFYDDLFYNVIAMLKEDGIYYYCNISSPAAFDSEGLKYIDYDLDVRVTPDYKYKILDRYEYERHSEYYHYDDKLKKVLEAALKDLIKKIKSKKGPFNHDYILDIYEQNKNKI